MKDQVAVGKWILCKSNWIGGVCSVTPMLVKKVSGKRIYVERLMSEWSCEEQRYIFTKETIDDGFVRIDSVVFSFDSVDDAIFIAEQQKSMHEDWFTNQKREMNKKIVELAKSRMK
ncbi:MAG: hypothetical protein ACRDBQ_05840 [Shewanella sp.]